MEYIENILVINNIDSSAINVMQFITLIMEEVEKDKNLKGPEKKAKVISILKEFTTNDNIFIKCNNKLIIDNITTILNNQMI